jgi:hypothetical protein
MSSDSGNLSPSRSDLSFDEDKREKTWLLAHFKDPQAVTYTRLFMSAVRLSEKKMVDLTSYMLSLNK